MYIRHDIGKDGEELAKAYLLGKGYKIVDKNFSCKQGEIDIIAKDKNELVFIEVKTRTNIKYGAPIDAITCYKKKHLIRTIKYYLYLNKLENCYIRIDAIQIYIKNEKIYINHVKGIM